MIIKYRANYKTLEITQVQCSRETQLCVYVFASGTAYRANKGGPQVDYFDSWHDAWRWLIDSAIRDRANAYEKYQALKNIHARLSEMKEPQNETLDTTKSPVVARFDNIESLIDALNKTDLSAGLKNDEKSKSL